MSRKKTKQIPMDDETLAMLDEMVRRSGENNRSLVVRTAIREKAARDIPDFQPEQQQAAG
jgi:metal-responsive CopG/Arc/MetJ family transcriptional regulator